MDEREDRRCTNCNSNELIFEDGEICCTNCGVVNEQRCVSNDFYTNAVFKGNDGETKTADRPLSTSKPGYSRYSRKSHFNEVVAQRKGCGGEVSEDLVEKVKEIWKVYHRLPKTEKTMIFLLGLIGERTSYEHAPQLVSIIFKIEPKFTTNEQDHVLARMFEEANIAWENAPYEVKGDRYSFPNYKDFMKRCCIYQGYDSEEATLKGLKNPKKIREMNQIWSYFGSYCNWDGWECSLMPEG